MNRVQSHGLCLAVTLTGALCAQNEIRHLDNFGSASRASIAPTVSATLLQRIPADQVHRPSGAGVTGFTAILQCAGSLLPQQFFYELRHNDAAGATTGVPDTAGAATGVAGPFTFPADPGATAYQFIFTFNTPIAVPQVSGVPAGDLYSDVVLPVPAPGDAPLMMQIGFHEPMRASAIGYTGTPGIAGLAWSVVTGLGSPAIVSQNVAWALGTRFSSDVCQPFARRGNNDNFGYAGLFPDTIGGDQPGWRVRATANAGSASVLVLSTGLLAAPVAIPGIGGLLGLDPASGLVVVMIAPTATNNGMPTGTSEARFGPFATSLSGGVNVFAQVLTIDAVSTGLRLSTACRVNF